MKVTAFHLMPYRPLPADVTERYRSIWVDLPNELYDPENGAELYHEYFDTLEHAATLGFDAIGVNEHHQNAYGLMPSPNVFASILARNTKDVGIMVMGNTLALYNPPLRIAEEYAVLDGISRGRLIAGFVVGTAMDATMIYGTPPPILREKFR